LPLLKKVASKKLALNAVTRVNAENTAVGTIPDIGTMDWNVPDYAK
jgi:hypothetical protein